MTDKVRIARESAPRVWMESDIFGTTHIKVQHEGMEAFDFIQIQYQYPYTDNASNEVIANRILAMLGGAARKATQ